MKLEKWLKETKTSIKDFAKKIGRSEKSVYNYLYKKVIPKCDAMFKIYHETDKLVAPDDFYDLPPICMLIEERNKEEARLRAELSKYDISFL